MADLIKILEEHITILHARGYAEIGLGTEDEPGYFVKQMENAFSHNLKGSGSEKNIQAFELKGIGFFNNETDMIEFIFRYKFNPTNKTIDLLSMKAEMGNSANEIHFIKGIYEIPYLDKLISMLKIQNQGQSEFVSGAKSSRDEHLMQFYKKVLTEHQTLLAVKGYTDKAYFPYTNNFLFKKLETRFAKRFWDETQPQEFTIRTDGFFGNAKKEVNFNLFYTISQTDRKLNLNAVMANQDEKRALCYLKEANDLPAATSIWNQMSESLNYTNVNIIYPKEQIKIILRQQEDLLGTMGYYKTFISNNSNFIERELQDSLQKYIQETTNQTITISRDIQLNLKDSLNCTFYYVFNPVDINLQLESLTARVGKAEKKYFHLDQHRDITLQNMFHELTGGNRQQLARSIIDRMTSEKSGISYRNKL